MTLAQGAFAVSVLSLILVGLFGLSQRRISKRVAAIEEARRAEEVVAGKRAAIAAKVEHEINPRGNQSTFVTRRCSAPDVGRPRRHGRRGRVPGGMGVWSYRRAPAPRAVPSPKRRTVTGTSRQNGWRIQEPRGMSPARGTSTEILSSPFMAKSSAMRPVPAQSPSESFPR